MQQITHIFQKQMELESHTNPTVGTSILQTDAYFGTCLCERIFPCSYLILSIYVLTYDF